MTMGLSVNECLHSKKSPTRLTSAEVQDAATSKA